MMIIGLLFVPSDGTKRKILEKRAIFKLETLFPAGLNKQFNNKRDDWSYSSSLATKKAENKLLGHPTPAILPVYGESKIKTNSVSL